MQSCSVQRVAYALPKTPLLVDRACAFLACKSRLCAFARGFSESCSDSLMLSPVLFFFFFLRVLIQLTMCSSHGSKDRNKCSVVRESVSCLLRCRYGRGTTTTTSGTRPALKLSLK
ncbi:unnamed protein product [Sphagnum jensenii]|uniref:Secreted protein n=1 Tax=Sphagnum jensenii TaxID=128206 RepID=A0ABP1A725_9BRYO